MSKQLTDNQFARYLEGVVDTIFTRCWVRGWSYKDVAAHAGVSPDTVSRLWNGWTKSPHLKTVAKLARAVDMELTVSLLESKRRAA